MSTAAALARWLVALEVIGWGLYPYLYLATPGLRDRGLTVAKPFALLLFAYPAWLLTSLGPPLFITPVLLGAFVVLAALGWVLASRAAPSRHSIPEGAATHGPDGPPRDGGAGGDSLPAFLRASWPYVLAAEVLFVAAFLGYAWLRSYNPEILGTEKPMEIGFLSAATRGATMPPPDPWLSGYTINYYYLGYVIVAAVAKVTGIVSSVAFNLGLATLFAATLSGGTGVTANLLARAGAKQRPLPRLRTLGAGLLGGYLLALAGNMYAARDILEHGRQAIDAWWWGGLGWNASRVVIDTGFPARFFGANAPPSPTINEFPSFSFILGDLHAHVLALPFTLLALALALDAWFAPPLAPPRPPMLGGAGSGDAGASSRSPLPGGISRLKHLGSPRGWGAGGGVARLLLAAFAIGSLYALNSWDLPTYAVIYLFALALPEFFRGRVGARRWVAGGIFVALAMLLFVPYYLHFTSLVGGQPFDLPEPWRSIPLVSSLSQMLGIVIWSKTPPDQFFTVYLLPYVVGLLFLAWFWRRVGGGKGGWTVPALVVLGLALGATLLQMPVLFLAGLLVALTLAILSRAAARDADIFAAVLIGSAFALVLVTEVFFIHDIFGNRMNTVFKVYYQAWTLLAVGCGYALARTIFNWRQAPAERLWRVPAAGAAALLLLASVAYPLASSWARTNHLQGQSGLDGLAYVKTALPNEYAGIEWVRTHVPAGTVVAEAPGCSYGELNGVPHDRVSAFAGVSTPIGWAGHEEQWRGGAPDLLAQIAPRQADVNTLYSTTDVAQAEQILDRYHIQYVYVGVFERSGYSAGGIGADCKAGPPYPAAGLAKFDTMMTRVFSQGNVTIYERR